MKTLYQNTIAALVMATCAAITQAAPLPGAIYTSTPDGTTVNGNIYSDCRDVYLNGGPQNNNFSGLPDGVYVFKVTNPSTGVLLSTDDAKYRQVLVQGERIYGVPPADKLQFGVVPSDPLHAVGIVNAANTSLPVQLWEFSETPNPGREYKVTVYRVTDANGTALLDSSGTPFVAVNGLEIISSQDNAKSDNFKCLHQDDDPPPGNIPPPVIITGLKYYDANHNGVYDGVSESWAGRPVVTIEITFTDPDHPLDPPLVATTETSEFDGSWAQIIPQGSTFTACEVVPTGYLQTGPLAGDTVTNASANADQCWTGNVSDPNAINPIFVGGLNFGNVDFVSISGAKYYDANANGVRDASEVGIAGFKIALSITYADETTANIVVLTDSTGAWSYDTLPIGSSVMVSEVLPSGDHWMQTGPVNGATIGALATASSGHWSALDVDQSITGLDFGNLCLGAGGGHTLGFWSNKNGQARFDAGDLAAMVALNLRNANGTAFNPTNYSGYKSWLLKATATNMAYMLSAQLSAMQLNAREAGFVSGTALVYAPGAGNTGVNNEFITINDLIAAANTELGLHGLTLSGNSFRTYQEALKNALDAGNNNLNFIQAGPCPVVYP